MKSAEKTLRVFSGLYPFAAPPASERARTKGMSFDAKSTSSAASAALTTTNAASLRGSPVSPSEKRRTVGKKLRTEAMTSSSLARAASLS